MTTTRSPFSPDTKSLILFLAISGITLTMPSLAHAAGAGGGGFQWEGNLIRLVQSFTGPFAYAMTMLGLVGAAVGLWFAHHEASGFIKNAAYVVLVGSFLMGATAFANAMQWTGAVV